MAIWLSASTAGSGQPHIICPMEKYIRTIKNTSDDSSLFFKTGVSLSFNSSSSPNELPAAELPFLVFSAALLPFLEAPYPASVTAFTISCSDAVPSTPIELVRRLTEHDVTPGTLDTAFSTRVLHAAQLMPVTVYCSILLFPPVFMISGG